MILRVAFPICTNCPPSKNTCFNGIFAYVRNAMARSAPIEDATTSSISLIPCLSLLFDFFKIYCQFLHRNFYHLKTILQKFLFECKERMIYRHSGNVFNFSKSQLEIVCFIFIDSLP